MIVTIFCPGTNELPTDRGVQVTIVGRLRGALRAPSGMPGMCIRSAVNYALNEPLPRAVGQRMGA